MDLGDTCTEVARKRRGLGFRGPVTLGACVWEQVTKGFSDVNGQVGEHEFHLMILQHLNMYLMRNVSAAGLGAADPTQVHRQQVASLGCR